MTFSEMLLIWKSLDGHCPECDAAATGNFYLLSSFITHVSPPKARRGNPHRRRRHEDGGDAGGWLFTQAERGGSARFGLLFLPTQFAWHWKRGTAEEDVSLQGSPFPPRTVRLCLCGRWL